MSRRAAVAGVVALLALPLALVPTSAPREEPRAPTASSLIPPVSIDAPRPTIPATTTTASTTIMPPASTEAPRPTSTTARASRSGVRTTTTTSPAPTTPPPTAPDAGEAVHLGRFRVTCYQLTANNTATGTRPGPGTIAVDPAVIRLGTHLRLDGIGDGTARDTGGAIKGYKLDWWRSSCAGWANPTVDVWRLP